MTSHRVQIFIVLYLALAPVITLSQPMSESKKMDKKKSIKLDSADWKSVGFFLLSVNQAARSDWGSGGENFQIGVNLLMNKSVHHKKGKYTFDSYKDLELGLMESSSIKKFRKTSDRLDWTMEFEHSLGPKPHFYYGFLANVNTQIFGGHNYLIEGHPKISSFLSPGKIIFAVGMDYKHTNEDHYFSAFISPATLRLITKLDPDFFKLNRFGVDSADKVYLEIGPYFSAHYNKSITKNVSYTGRLDLFSNYKKQFGIIDLLMNNLFTFAFSKTFAGSFICDLLYDEDMKNRLQVQEIIGFGLRLRL